MGQVDKIGELAARDHRCQSAPLQRGSEKVMSIEALTADGKKQVPLGKRAGVDGVSGCRLLRRVALARPEIGSNPTRDILSLQLHWIRSLGRNTCRAMATSSNGITRPPMVWGFSRPLP